MNPPSERGLSRREAAAARARKDILEAAARAFAQRGYAGTKVADIAQEAGFTAASLYTYFPGKRDIFMALVELIVGELYEVLAFAPPPALSALDRLEARLRHLLEWVEHRRDGFTVFFALERNAAPDLAELDDPYADHRPEDAVRLAFEQWLGELTPPHALALPLPTVALALAGLVDGFIRQFIKAPADGALVAETQTLIHLLLHGATKALGEA